RLAEMLVRLPDHIDAASCRPTLVRTGRVVERRPTVVEKVPGHIQPSKQLDPSESAKRIARSESLADPTFVSAAVLDSEEALPAEIERRPNVHETVVATLKTVASAPHDNQWMHTNDAHPVRVRIEIHLAVQER